MDGRTDRQTDRQTLTEVRTRTAPAPSPAAARAPAEFFVPKASHARRLSFLFPKRREDGYFVCGSAAGTRRGHFLHGFFTGPFHSRKHMHAGCNRVFTDDYVHMQNAIACLDALCCPSISWRWRGA